MPSIETNALVAISEYPSSVPVAVGRMVLPSTDIKEDMKGKAVHVIHTWKDTLWNSGSKGDPPESILDFTAAPADEPPLDGEDKESPPQSKDLPITTREPSNTPQDRSLSASGRH